LADSPVSFATAAAAGRGLAPAWITSRSAAELAAHYSGAVKGEVVLVVGAAPPGRAGRELALGTLRELIDAGAKARPAAAAVAKLTGLGANELYRELMRGGQ
jgi:16S rRNA (cytidine1402-2'-O)-methyltransferase